MTEGIRPNQLIVRWNKANSGTVLIKRLFVPRHLFTLDLAYGCVV
jgi:hypothetical protein